MVSLRIYHNSLFSQHTQYLCLFPFSSYLSMNCICFHKAMTRLKVLEGYGFRTPILIDKSNTRSIKHPVLILASTIICPKKERASFHPQVSLIHYKMLKQHRAHFFLLFLRAIGYIYFFQ